MLIREFEEMGEDSMQGEKVRTDKFKLRVKKETAGNEHSWSEGRGSCSSVKYQGRHYTDWWEVNSNMGEKKITKNMTQASEEKHPKWKCVLLVVWGEFTT